ncbi:Spermidine export protein MdtI [Salmonella enterica subsp. enterica serovar Urbana str. R8-2977]|uniref:Spermidine export protein MdtI n=1 Tax=Salmonella enterica subsp. enterica serovar Urbana str. R8-2977 TaxID=913084 RepID=G5RVL5_SALET|nr:Spermidine export protein MdtI [Salmonella enterica subsp. enterica serovar Urbana str. R8-2977]
MQQFEWIHGAWLGLAIMLEIAANVLLKFSDGFRRKCYGILSLAAVLAAFSALSQAVKGIDLSVAYALWGGFGIAATLARRAGCSSAPRWRRAGCSSASA